jgi:hypothetical protein
LVWFGDFGLARDFDDDAEQFGHGQIRERAAWEALDFVQSLAYGFKSCVQRATRSRVALKAVTTVEAQQQARGVCGKMGASDRGTIFEPLQQFGDMLLVRPWRGVLWRDPLRQVGVEKFVEPFR